MTVKSLTRFSPAIRPGGLTLWYAVIAGIVAWFGHIFLIAALARWTCNETGTRWVLDVLTLVTAAATLVAIWLCAGIIRGSGEAETEGTPVARTRFLGVFGLMLGAINLLLILAEGSYAWFISPCT